MALTTRAADSLRRDFEEFGLNGYEARVLVALLRVRSANATELAQLAGIRRTSVYPVLQELTARGLALSVPGKVASWASLGSTEMLERLYEAQEEWLQGLRGHKERTQRSLAHLSATSASGLLPHVLFVRGAAQLKRTYEQILERAEDEILVFNMPPYSWEAGKPNASILKACKRGVRFRALYQDAEIMAPEAVALRGELRRYHEAGVQPRVVDSLQVKLIVADRAVTLLAIPHEQLGAEGYPTTLHVEHPGYSGLQADGFEHRWASARPYLGDV